MKKKKEKQKQKRSNLIPDSSASVGEPLVFDDHGRRQTDAWRLEERSLAGRKGNYDAASDKDGENNDEDHESLSRAFVCSASVGQLCKRPARHAAVRINHLHMFLLLTNY